MYFGIRLIPISLFVGRVARQETVDFSRHVKPILKADRVARHDCELQPHTFQINNYGSVINHRTFGVSIVRGHPERSPFLTTTKSAHTIIQSMPPVGERLTFEEVETFKRWIRQSARWPVLG